jgi:hypothetical protein
MAAAFAPNSGDEAYCSFSEWLLLMVESRWNQGELMAEMNRRTGGLAII